MYLRDEILPRKVAERQEFFDGEGREPSVFLIGEQGFKAELKNFGVKVANAEEEPYLSTPKVTPARFAQ